jgi:hypothetical protein
MDNSNLRKSVKEAFLFAIGFFILAIVIKIYNSTGISTPVKIASIFAYAIGVLYFFSHRQLIHFAGFSFMLLSYNYILDDKYISNIWKILGAIVILTQFGTLDKIELTENKES